MPHTRTSAGRKLSPFFQFHNRLSFNAQRRKFVAQIIVTGVKPEFGAAQCMVTHRVPWKGTPRHSRQSASSNAMPIRNCVDIIHPDWKLLVFQGLQFTKVVTSTEKRAADNALSLRIRSGACAIQCFSIPVST